jgi:hypothetical protein
MTILSLADSDSVLVSAAAVDAAAPYVGVIGIVIIVALFLREALDLRGRGR